MSEVPWFSVIRFQQNLFDYALLAFDFTLIWEVLLTAAVLIQSSVVSTGKVADVSEERNALILGFKQFEKLDVDSGGTLLPETLVTVCQSTQ